MGQLIDIMGMHFGKLTVIDRAKNNARNRAMWLCRCDCGNERVVLGDDLRSGKVISCGCVGPYKYVRKDRHGLRGTRLYRIWANMKDRCLNRNHPRYYQYGGRGITICDIWLQFRSFYEWAIANGYQDDLSIDRIDNDGNYCPENCRWVSMKIQNNNKSRNACVTVYGANHTIAEWADLTGIPYEILYGKYKAFARLVWGKADPTAYESECGKGGSPCA